MFYEIPYEFSCSKNSTGIYINNEDNKIFFKYVESYYQQRNQNDINDFGVFDFGRH